MGKGTIVGSVAKSQPGALVWVKCWRDRSGLTQQATAAYGEAPIGRRYRTRPLWSLRPNSLSPNHKLAVDQQHSHSDDLAGTYYIASYGYTARTSRSKKGCSGSPAEKIHIIQGSPLQSINPYSNLNRLTPTYRLYSYLIVTDII